MIRFSTFDPPAAITQVAPDHSQVTNEWYCYSLTDAQISSAFEGAQRELDRYKQYRARWDGYRAIPFDNAVLTEASSILDYSQMAFLSAGVVPNLLTTGPASDGSIDVEMKSGEKRLLMTIYPGENNVKVYGSDNVTTHEHLVPLGTQRLARWLSWLPNSNRVPADLDQDRVHP